MNLKHAKILLTLQKYTEKKELSEKVKYVKKDGLNNLLKIVSEKTPSTFYKNEKITKSDLEDTEKKEIIIELLVLFESLKSPEKIVIALVAGFFGKPLKLEEIKNLINLDKNVLETHLNNAKDRLTSSEVKETFLDKKLF